MITKPTFSEFNIMSSDPKKRVAAAAQRPENQRCADCGCKLLTSSIWASSTLGIFICINCSGRHRNLGTHITFVRSVNLDSWTDEQATVMESIGNEVSNKYWEANLPSDYPRPATEDLEGLTKFIRLKYELGKWADKSREAPNVVLKKGGKVKRAKIQTSNSSQPVQAAPAQTVQRSQSTNTFNLSQPAPTMAQSNSVDMLFGPPTPSPIQPTMPQQQQPQMNSTPGFNPFMQGFGQPSMPQPAPQPQFGTPGNVNPFAFGKPIAPNAFQPQAQQPPQAGNARAELQSMLSQNMGAGFTPANSTNVFRAGQQPTSVPPTQARNLFNQPSPLGNAGFNQPARGPGMNRSRDAFGGISPF